MPLAFCTSLALPGRAICPAGVDRAAQEDRESKFAGSCSFARLRACTPHSRQRFCMLAYIVLLLAVLSRILPHAFHAVNWNFTAVGGGPLFFGSRMGACQGSAARGFHWTTAAKLASALAVLMATDYYLTVYAFHAVNWNFTA